MSNLKIAEVKAREIIDCRGLPTLEVDVILQSGSVGRVGVPAGRSRSQHEAVELRDNEKRFGGLGVRKAVNNVNDTIAKALIGMDASQQRLIDTFMVQELDGSGDKSKLGSNAIVGVSMAVARAAANQLNLPLYRYLNSRANVIPTPMFNLINGGKHASSVLEIQEFMIIPVEAKNLMHSFEIAFEVNSHLRDIVITKYGTIAANVGDEGGFVPPLTDANEGLDMLMESIDRAGYSKTILLGLDVAASHFYDVDSRTYQLGNDKYDKAQMIELYKGLCQQYPIVSIEDPLHEDDFEGWADLTREVDIQIVGDDFFATNPERVIKGIEYGAANAVLWKVNQIGTLTEALDVAELAFRNGYGVQVSERSGETEDSIIADIAVALNCGQIKTGAPIRGERTSKYNQLLRIEEELGSEAHFAGGDYRWNHKMGIGSKSE
jgi:enolase